MVPVVVGVKTPVVSTPGPDQLPPVAGVNPVSCCDALPVQMANPVPASALTGLITVTISVSEFEQLLLLVDVYVSVNVPGLDGVKTPAAVTPGPLQVPPIGVPVVMLNGIDWLQSWMSAPALTLGSGLTVIFAVSVFWQPLASVPVSV